MNRRPGVTLVEVLVAIFVAGIGMLALLVLFPLGALNMAQAVRDDRAAQAGLQAAALANALDYRTDSNLNAQLSAGNPVYVDGIAVQIMGKTDVVGFLGGTGAAPASLLIPRLAPGSLTSNRLALLRFTMPDDLAYDKTTGFADLSTGFVNRGGRYSWAYMARRPQSSALGVVDLAVVVYDNRNFQIPGGESYFTPAAAAAVGASSITLSYTGTPPNLHRGSWILDASASAATEPDFGTAHSFFYRVVDVTDLGGNTLQLDLQTPLRAAIPATGVIVFPENVIDVFERRTGIKP